MQNSAGHKDRLLFSAMPVFAWFLLLTHPFLQGNNSLETGGVELGCGTIQSSIVKAP